MREHRELPGKKQVTRFQWKANLSQTRRSVLGTEQLWKIATVIDPPGRPIYRSFRNYANLLSTFPPRVHFSSLHGNANAARCCVSQRVKSVPRLSHESCKTKNEEKENLKKAAKLRWINGVVIDVAGKIVRYALTRATFSMLTSDEKQIETAEALRTFPTWFHQFIHIMEHRTC